MTPNEFLEILHVAERLKNVTRHCDTTSGRRESVAEHCWRVSLMAMLLRGQFPGIDMDRVIELCLIHDLGECFTGDIPTFSKTADDDALEKARFDEWIADLPPALRARFKDLCAEMNARRTPEAKLCKALDRLEALIQHNESDIASWLPLEYDLQRTYAFADCEFDPWIRALRQAVLRDTEEKIAAAAPKME